MQHSTETSTRRARALLAFESDIRNRTLIDWLKAHTSFLYPLHRYNGKIVLEARALTYEGVDVKLNEKFELQAPVARIVDVYYGFDSVFRRFEERGLGMFGMLKPLRIRYIKNSHELAIYLIIDFHRLSRKSNNEEWFKLLTERLYNARKGTR